VARNAGSIPTPPDLPAQLAPGAACTLAHDGYCAETGIEGARFDGAHARGLRLETVRLAGVEAAGARLESFSVLDTALRDCDLAGIDGRRGSLWRVTIHGTRLTGAMLAESTLRDVTLRDCRIDLASFAGARLERVTFESCRLTETGFLEAQLDRVRFHDCDLTRADLRGATLRACELRGCELDDLQGIEQLRGAAMPWADIVGSAGVFARALGIKILENEADRR
jgi:uncharacterized protein YjbI with pentapeptide repeats